MQQILDRIGALGYPITAQNFNMLHNEQMVDFYQKIKSGKDAEIAAFLVDTYGSLVECAFKYQSGKLFITQLDASWNSSKQLFVSDDDFGYIDKFKMTDNGYFLYHAKCAKSYQDSSGGFRVRPLPSEDYALYKKYIEPVGYLGNNLFVTTWDKKTLARLNFNDMFQYIYNLEYRKSPDYQTPYQNVTGACGSFLSAVPAKD